MPEPDSKTLAEALAQRAVETPDAAAIERAKRHLLDWLACVAAASQLPERRAVLASMASASRCGLALADADCSAPMAILADGSAGSLLEMDDVHRAAVLHPGPVVIPAALGAARATGATSGALLAGIAIGYEIMIRIGCGMGQAHYRYWHPSSTCGAFGAAAAAGRILELEPEAHVWALGNAGTRTGGLWQMRHEPVPSKAIHTGLAAQSGWLAADLAARGFAGPRRLLEGEQGLLAATAPDAEPERMLADADDWRLHEVSFKPWPACRHAHPAIDALLQLDTRPAPEDIERIVVTTYRAAAEFCDKPEPTTPLQARFSIQHALAAVIVYGLPRLDHYSDRVIADSRVAAMRRRISVQVADRFSDAFPFHYGAGIALVGTDGRTSEAVVDDAWGDPERPLDDDDLSTKARELMLSGGWQARSVERVIESTLGMRDDADIPGWFALIEGAAE